MAEKKKIRNMPLNQHQALENLVGTHLSWLEGDVKLYRKIIRLIKRRRYDEAAKALDELPTPLMLNYMPMGIHRLIQRVQGTLKED